MKTPTTLFETNKLTLSSNISEEITIPLGLCYLVSALKEKRYEAEIFDPHLNVYDEYTSSRDPKYIKRAIKERFAKGEYDLVGVSSQFIYAYKWAHLICEYAKEANPDIPIVIGGGHPSVILEETLNDRNIDYLIAGEAEVSFPALLDTLNEDDHDALAKISGLIYRDRTGALKNNEITSFIPNLDSIAFPNWDAIDVNHYMDIFAKTSSEHKRTLMMITSRGCPFKCTFCNVFQSWGSSFRKRSPENVMEEIDYLIGAYGVEQITFVDDNMTIDKRRSMEICKGLQNRNITWSVVNVASFVTNKAMLNAMKKSGCTKVSISVESGSKQVLKDMKKPVDLGWSEKVIKICREIGIPVTVNFVTGLPYETKKDMMKTFRWAEKVRADWSTFSILVPYPGTEIFEYCRDRGYLDPHSLNLEGLSQRNPTIETEQWTRDWVGEKTYHYNIMINFLRNYNLVEEDGNLSYITGFLENICLHHKKHIIARISLAYAYHRRGMDGESNELLVEANRLIGDDEVIETFGNYLSLDEKPVVFFNEYLERKNIVNVPNSPETKSVLDAESLV